MLWPAAAVGCWQVAEQLCSPRLDCSKALAQACSCSYKFVRMNKACNSFDMEFFEASLTDKTRLVILNSPSNPTGDFDYLRPSHEPIQSPRRPD